NRETGSRDSCVHRRIVFIFAALSAACLILQSCSGNSSRPAVARLSAVPVVGVPAASKSVPVNIRSIGNVEAYSTISVKAQVGGELTRVYFKEGDYVKKGDLLFLIDTRPYDAALQQAEANLA